MDAGADDTTNHEERGRPTPVARARRRNIPSQSTRHRQGAEANARALPQLFDEWIPTSRTLDLEQALQTIAERYFTSHGPATLRDFALLDGRVCGTWRRITKASSVAVACTPFGRISAADKKAFAQPVERYARYLGMPVSMSWTSSCFNWKRETRC